MAQMFKEAATSTAVSELCEFLGPVAYFTQEQAATLTSPVTQVSLGNQDKQGFASFPSLLLHHSCHHIMEEKVQVPRTSAASESLQRYEDKHNLAFALQR